MVLRRSSIVGEDTGDFAANKARFIEDAFGNLIDEMESMIGATEDAAEPHNRERDE